MPATIVMTPNTPQIVGDGPPRSGAVTRSMGAETARYGVVVVMCEAWCASIVRMFARREKGSGTKSHFQKFGWMSGMPRYQRSNTKNGRAYTPPIKRNTDLCTPFVSFVATREEASENPERNGKTQAMPGTGIPF